MVKWIIAGVATLIYLIFLFRKREEPTGYFPVDVEGAFGNIIGTMLYLVFWIIWLIIF